MDHKDKKENPVTKRRRENIDQTLRIINALTRGDGQIRYNKALAVIIRTFGVSEKIARGYIDVHCWDGSILIDKGWIRSKEDEDPSHSQ